MWEAKLPHDTVDADGFHTNSKTITEKCLEEDVVRECIGWLAIAMDTVPQGLLSLQNELVFGIAWYSRTLHALLLRNCL